MYVEKAKHLYKYIQIYDKYQKLLYHQIELNNYICHQQILTEIQIIIHFDRDLN